MRPLHYEVTTPDGITRRHDEAAMLWIWPGIKAHAEQNGMEIVIDKSGIVTEIQIKYKT